MKMFSKRVKYLRKMKNLTQKQLADELGLTLRTIQNYELGASMPRSKAVVARIADYFDVPVSSLFEADDFYVADAERKGGKKAGSEMRILLSDMSALFAGGTLSDEDKDLVMKTLSDLYWDDCRRRQKAAKAAQSHDA